MGRYATLNNKELTLDLVSKISVKRKDAKGQASKGALIQAPLRANLTSYSVDDVVRFSNGALMVCVVGGTSSASEPTFSATALVAEAAGPTWSFLGKGSKLNNDGYQVPSISTSSTIPAGATLNNLYSSTSADGSPHGGSITAGSGYVNGTYTNVPLIGGSGTGCIAAQIVVSGGAVTTVKLDQSGSGSGYTYGNALSADNSNLGGSGSGFVYTLNALWQTPVAWADQSNVQKTGIVSNAYSIGLSKNNGDTSSPINYGARIVRFLSDDPNIGIAFHNSSGFKPVVFVDGYRIEEAATKLVAGNPCYYIINWGGVRKEREYKLINLASKAFKGVAVLPTSTLHKPVNSNIFGVFVGDSMGDTVSTYSGSLTDIVNNIDTQVFLRVGLTPVTLGKGGTGYDVGKADNDANLTSTAYNAKAMLQFNDYSSVANDVASVIFCHGTNDTESASMLDAALDTWRYARQLFPNAIISVFGPLGASGGPSTTRLSMDNSLYAKFLIWGDNKSFYHKVPADPVKAWQDGTGKLGSTTGSGNGDFIVGADGTHPTTMGREYFTQRITEYVESDLSYFGL